MSPQRGGEMEPSKESRTEEFTVSGDEASPREDFKGA